MLIAIAVAGALAAVFVGRRFGARASGAWAGLLVVGQAGALRWVEAGPVVAYQHVLPPGEFARDPIGLGLVGLQVLLVGWGLWRHREISRWVGRLPRPVLAATLALAFGFAVAPSADPRSYGLELAVGFALQLVALANVGLVVHTFRLRPAPARRRPDRTRPIGRGPDRFALGAAAATTLACALLAAFAYERHPHVPDEVAYLLHARYLAAGHLAMQPPPVPEAFELDLMRYEPERWYSPVPPGWPAILAIGVRLGAPWLVNPVLAGIGVLLAFGVAVRLYDRPTARWAAALMSVSPWYLFLGMSFMTHMASFALALASVRAVLRWRDGGGASWLAAAGVAAGGVSLVRPLEGVAVAGFLGLAILWLARGRGPWIPAAAFGLSAIAAGAAVFPYNASLTGSPTRFPIMEYTEALYGPGANALGFGPDRGLGWTGLDPFPGHGPRDVVVNTLLNGYAINIELFGWATGAVAVLVGLTWLRRRSPADLAVLAALATPIALHAFYWFAGGPDFGARYWFLTLAPLILLTARGVSAPGERVGPGGRVAVMALSLAAVVTFLPWRAVDKYHLYRGMRPDVRALADDPQLDGALVLVKGRRHPDFASAAVYNPLELDGPGPIFAWYRDEETRQRVEAAFPGRRVVILEGPSLTGSGYLLRRATP